MSSERPFSDAISKELMILFPEARLTMRDKLPTALLFSARILEIGKKIDNIKYSAEELRESMLGLVAMIPEEIKDDEFYKELKAAKQLIPIDVRPSFCEVKATEEYCKRKGLPIIQYVETFNYQAVFNAVFNLFHRERMLFKVEPKEIFTGKKARGEEPEFEPEADEF